MTATITFKAKVHHVKNADGTHAFDYVPVPMLTRSHCDMPAFRSHPKFGGLANSDLFPNILARLRAAIGERIKLSQVPENVTVDATGFLATVSIRV